MSAGLFGADDSTPFDSFTVQASNCLAISKQAALIKIMRPPPAARLLLDGTVTPWYVLSTLHASIIPNLLYLLIPTQGHAYCAATRVSRHTQYLLSHHRPARDSTRFGCFFGRDRTLHSMKPSFFSFDCYVCCLPGLLNRFWIRL
jgi:hypothetical protein